MGAVFTFNLDTGFTHDSFEVIPQARSGVERGKADKVANL
jgi:hypothetical protein